MAGSGRWWAPLVVATGAVVAPIAAIVWQGSQPLAPPATPASVAERPTPAPVIVVDQSRLAPPPVVANIAPTATPMPRWVPPTLPTPTSAPIEVWRRESSFNFVALGVDRRVESEIPRTDTVMIGSVDLNQRRLTLISIPRDLVVDIPGYGQDRVNTAYVYGEQFRERDGGIGLVRRTIEKNFGIPIHHYGLIDFTCFRTAIDAVGGVTVDVPSSILDTRYPTDDYGYKTVRFEPGPQRLNGDRALEYARTRNADNDFNRMRRQQEIASAMRREVLQLRSVPAFPTMVAGCRGLSSDLGLIEYIGLGRALQKLTDKDITMKTIDEHMAVDAYLGGAAVLIPRWEPIRALVRESFFGARTAAARPGATH